MTNMIKEQVNINYEQTFKIFGHNDKCCYYSAFNRELTNNRDYKLTEIISLPADFEQRISKILEFVTVYKGCIDTDEEYHLKAIEPGKFLVYIPYGEYFNTKNIKEYNKLTLAKDFLNIYFSYMPTGLIPTDLDIDIFTIELNKFIMSHKYNTSDEIKDTLDILKAMNGKYLNPESRYADNYGIKYDELMKAMERDEC